MDQATGTMLKLCLNFEKIVLLEKIGKLFLSTGGRYSYYLLGKICLFLQVIVTLPRLMQEVISGLLHFLVVSQWLWPSRTRGGQNYLPL